MQRELSQIYSQRWHSYGLFWGERKEDFYKDTLWTMFDVEEKANVL
jgi:hypothetical protein